MIIVTTETIADRKIVSTLGLARGNTIRARHIGRDILAGLRTIVGGEIHEYAKLLGEAREQALDRMVEEARELGQTPWSTFAFQPPSSWAVPPKCWLMERPSNWMVDEYQSITLDATFRRFGPIRHWQPCHFMPAASAALGATLRSCCRASWRTP